MSKKPLLSEYLTSKKENKTMNKVGFKRLTEDAILPVKAHATDSGFDLFANEDVIISPGETKVVGTGIAIKLPEGYEAQVRPRSGVTSKTKLRVQLGTIDNSYRGEIGIIVDNVKHIDDEYNSQDYLYDIQENFINVWNYLDNFNNFPSCSYLVKKGDKLAQLVIQELPQVETFEIDELDETERGNKGFGSSGYK